MLCCEIKHSAQALTLTFNKEFFFFLKILTIYVTTYKQLS